MLAANDNTVVLLDGAGRSEVIFMAPPPLNGESPSTPKSNEPGRWVMSPQPIRRQTRPPIIPDRVNPEATTGRFALTDIYASRNLFGVATGEIKRLLVLEFLPTPHGPIWPKVRPAWFLNRILGTVPVEADGSAYFEAPAMRALTFVALDDRGLSVKHKQSATELKPGEVRGCVGCHENRTQTPTAGRAAMAMRRGPSLIEPFTGIPDRIDYVADVQPIWDRHCVKCHSPDHREGAVLMTADVGSDGRLHSHLSLMAAGQVVDCRGPHTYGNVGPHRMGSGASALMKKIDGSHHGVKVEPREWETVSLWLDTMIPYHRYYLEQEGVSWGSIGRSMEAIENKCFTCHEKTKKRKLYCGSDLFADYRTGEDERNILFFQEPNPSHESDIQQQLPVDEADYLRQYLDCFSRNENQLRRGASIVINRTRPEKSLLLLAPLAKSAGGYATVSIDDVNAKKIKAMPIIFASTNDPDYQLILSDINRCRSTRPLVPDGKTRVQVGDIMSKRYVHFGLLPETIQPGDVYDAHEVMERFWEHTYRWGPDCCFLPPRRVK